jgi:hypothetical protein
LDTPWVDQKTRMRALRKKRESALIEVAGGNGDHSVTSLAQAARERGFEERPNVRDALRRGEREWQLDSAVQDAVHQYHPDPSELIAEVAELGRRLFRPATVTGEWSLHPTEAHALAVLEHYRKTSVEPNAVEASFLSLGEVFEVSLSSQACDLLLGPGRFAELRALDSGLVVSTGASAGGFSLFRKTSFHEEAPIESSRLEQLALEVLRRRYADELVSEILGSEETP